ncbi:hypothetical protein GCM10007860_15410 [Chitiniphilus shinanonensis]|uniref:Flagellar M-ring protein n=1 Tax=Chitiniphilus shinanonensis TaxID=553088 RepID=A0ABQ6BRZ1_9NEIS|nr:flagellar M-ring protein FliF C-terminal domain-containing protein [Chitiniphilus shinanonensis]GLS04394.1 hypothetical protein GCM10007860_15410 [Chitiniphilus shinanonensis]
MFLGLGAITNKSKPIFIVFVVAVAVLFSGVLYWIFYPRQAVLISGGDSRKILEVSTVLDKEKVPYSLVEDGQAITVPESALNNAKLKVFAADANLAHEVGLEIFSGGDLGMTDFTQHVNLVRALQGELSRTIGNLPGIGSARVHISVPEMSAGTRSRILQPKAAVTVTMSTKNDFLPEERVLAIQQVVAAAIPGLRLDEVSVIDGSGRPISGANESSAGSYGRHAQEAYLEGKVRQVLSPVVGASGGLSVAVAITYSQQHRKTLKEEPLAAGAYKQIPVGVLQSKRLHGAEVLAEDESVTDGVEGSAKQDEDLTFATGKFVEQVDEGPSAIIRLSASVIIRDPENPLSDDAYTNIVADALGMDTQRGDRVSVQVLESQVLNKDPLSSANIPIEKADRVAVIDGTADEPGPRYRVWFLSLLAFVFVVVGSVYLFRRTQSRRDVLVAELRALLSRLH